MASKRVQVVGCDLATAADKEGCRKTFIERCGRRAFRRPLVATEVTALLNLAKTASAPGLHALPQDALLDDAAKGEFDTPQGIETRVTARLKETRAMEVLRAFYNQWLHTSQIDDITRDPDKYPTWPALWRTGSLEGVGQGTAGPKTSTPAAPSPTSPGEPSRAGSSWDNG